MNPSGTSSYLFTATLQFIELMENYMVHSLTILNYVATDLRNLSYSMDSAQMLFFHLGICYSVNFVKLLKDVVKNLGWNFIVLRGNHGVAYLKIIQVIPYKQKKRIGEYMANIWRNIWFLLLFYAVEIQRITFILDGITAKKEITFYCFAAC